MLVTSHLSSYDVNVSQESLPQQKACRQQIDRNPLNDFDANIFQVKFDRLTLKYIREIPYYFKPAQLCQKSPPNYRMMIKMHYSGLGVLIFQPKKIIEVEKGKMPQNDQIIYLIHEQQVIGEVDNSVVFCIDTSGSMSSTVEIKKKVNFSQGISTEKNIKQFFEPGDEHQYSPLFNAKNVTPVSRKQRVLAAIEQKITEMKKTNPNKVVGLVTFNNEVVVYGDLAEAPHYCQRSPLQQEDIILEAAQLMSQPTKQQAEGLLKFEKYRRKRQYFWPRILCNTQKPQNKVAMEVQLNQIEELINKLNQLYDLIVDYQEKEQQERAYVTKLYFKKKELNDRQTKINLNSLLQTIQILIQNQTSIEIFPFI